MEPKKNPLKDVHRYSRHFFLIGLSFSLIVILMAFEWQSRVTLKPFHPDPVGEHLYVPYDIPVVISEHAEIPKPVKEIRLLHPDKIAESPDELSPDPEPRFETEPLEVSGPVQVDVPAEVPRDTIFWVVEKMPQPIGGFEAFYKQLGKTITYPAKAKRNGTEGKVLVEFVVAPNGEPMDFKLISGVGSGCDEEAIRVLKLSRWEPGKQRGRPVPVRKVLPVYFKLN